MDESLKAAFRERVERETVEVDRTILSLQEASQAVAPDNALGRLTRMEVMSDQQMSMAKLSQAQQRRANLSTLLRRLHLADFGMCRICQQPMDPERLLAVPDAVACAPCLNRLRARAPGRR